MYCEKGTHKLLDKSWTLVAQLNRGDAKALSSGYFAIIIRFTQYSSFVTYFRV